MMRPSKKGPVFKKRKLVEPMTIAAAAGVAALLTIIPSASAQQAISDPDTTTTAPVPMPAPIVSSGSSYVANLVNSTLESQFPDIYGGLNFNRSGSIVVHVVGETSAIQAAVTPLTANLPSSDAAIVHSVEYVPATESLAELNSRQATLEAEFPTPTPTSGNDFIITKDWVDIPNNAVAVTVTTDVTQATSVIGSKIGAENLEVTQGYGAKEIGRTTDASPWSGGDLIRGLLQCTSGFSVVDSNGVTYDETAGHCGNTTFTQNYQGYGVTYQWLSGVNTTGDQQTITTYPGSARGNVWINFGSG